MATKEAIISGNVTIICRIKICIEIGKVELEMEKEIKNELEKRGRTRDRKREINSRRMHKM